MTTSHSRIPLGRQRSLVSVAIVPAVPAATWCVAITRPTPALASPSQDRKELAEWWAPAPFHDVDTSGATGVGNKSDYITSYDFDGRGTYER